MPEIPAIVSVAGALPAPVSQADVRAVALELWPELESSRFLGIFDNAHIHTRHTLEPLDWYLHERSNRERFRAATAAVVALGVEAAEAALDRAGLTATEIDALVMVTTTTVRSPQVDVDVATRLGLRRDVHRIPLFGMASLGGAAGLGVAADLVRAGYGNVLVVASEANSLMFAPGPMTAEMVVSMALFSDGAAAAVVRASTSGDTAGPGSASLSTRARVIARSSTFLPDSVEVMGFDADDQGLHWHLAPTVAEIVAEELPSSIETALAGEGWSLDDIDHLLFHPGSVKVLQSAACALGLDASRFGHSIDVLGAHGNLSSATILLVLEAFLASRPAAGRGLLCGMGPGFGFETLLLEVGP